MPTIDPNHPRHAHRFGGVELQVPYPFKEGDVLTAPHAKQMNQWLATTVGNGFNRKLSDAVEAHNKAHPKEKIKAILGEDGKTVVTSAAAQLPNFDHQSAFDEAFGAYQLGVSNRGSGSSDSADPVMRQAQALARIQVSQTITRHGYKVRDFQLNKGHYADQDGKRVWVSDPAGNSQFSALVADYIDRNPWIVESARAQLAALAEHSAEGDGELDLGIESQPEGEAQAA